MNEIVYIYDKNLNLVGQPYTTSYEEFKKDPKTFFPTWENTMFASLEKYENPILDNGNIRDMTREEKILIKNEKELLEPGEILENGEIRKIDKPSGYKIEWKYPNWVETVTQNELLEIRKNKILEYSSLEKDKEDLLNSKFPATAEIESITERMKELEKEINDIASHQVYLEV